MTKNIKLYNWKTGNLISAETVAELGKKLNWSLVDRIHSYPLVRGERLVFGNYCLAHHIGKTYEIVTPQGKTIKVKNWIKFARKYGVGVHNFKRMLDGEILYHGGFYLKKNKEIVPRKLVRVVCMEINGKNVEFSNIRGKAEELGITREAIHRLINGSVSKCRYGKLKGIKYETESYASKFAV